MLNARVLFITDDMETSQLWAFGLQQRGLQVLLVESAQEALSCWADESFDLALINVYSDRLDEIQLCRELRAEITNPILIFTQYSDEPRLIDAYQAGADECIVKPIGVRLFMAKITAWLRRAWTVPAEALDTVQASGLRLEPAERQVITPEGHIIQLTNLEFRLLHLLMLHPGQVLESNMIVERVWGYNGSGDNTLLKNVVYRLRRKIEPDPARPQYLHTQAGEGYTFRPD